MALSHKVCICVCICVSLKCGGNTDVREDDVPRGVQAADPGPADPHWPSFRLQEKAALPQVCTGYY